MANLTMQLDDAFLALSDATRRSVLARLSRGPASVSALAQPFDMALPTFLKHIRLLEASGWIATRKEGRVRTCTFRPDTLALSQRWLTEQQEIWESRTDRLEMLVTGRSVGPSSTHTRKGNKK